jgi:hypothetical protein
LPGEMSLKFHGPTARRTDGGLLFRHGFHSYLDGSVLLSSQPVLSRFD